MVVHMSMAQPRLFGDIAHFAGCDPLSCEHSERRSHDLTPALLPYLPISFNIAWRQCHSPSQ
ncbi:hypothetical protein D3C71_1875620 [compost metagenome]